jgi:hypothetical protein
VAATNPQLKKQLAAAACTLLGSVPLASAGTFEGWDVDTSILHYHESDGRVSAIEPVIHIRRAFAGDRALNLKLTLDSLTGATPNGALPSTVPQTFTRPSGGEAYTVPTGQTPLDDTFHDTRVALNASWQQPISRLSLLSFGVNYSTEYDFVSMGGNVQLARDFNDRNTTLNLGLSMENDAINPEGGVPISFAAMTAPGTPQPRQGDSEKKTVVDALIGVTQVIDAKTIAQLNYSLSRSNGYLSDPYKLLSVTDPSTGLPQRYVYEHRPDTRLKHAIYGLLRRHLRRDIVSGSYRFFIDDWGIRSHTVDFNYRWKPSARWWLEPHVRFYDQSKADFYRLQLENGAPLPAEASADYRLGAFKGYTVGLQWGWTFKNETELILKAEYYTTRGQTNPGEVFGPQRGLELYPDLKATIFQIQYRF